MYPAYATKLGFLDRNINIGAQKINGSYLDTFRMVIADFSVKDKLGRVRFLQETLLLANIGLEMVLGMFFLTLSKADIRFMEWKLVWRTYTAAKALPTIRRVEIIDKRELAAAALNVDDETFIMHVVALAEPTIMLIYSSHQAQVASLTRKENGIPAEYSDFPTSFLQTLLRSYQSSTELIITLSICRTISNRFMAQYIA